MNTARIPLPHAAAPRQRPVSVALLGLAATLVLLLGAHLTTSLADARAVQCGGSVSCPQGQTTCSFTNATGTVSGKQYLMWDEATKAYQTWCSYAAVVVSPGSGTAPAPAPSSE